MVKREKRIEKQIQSLLARAKEHMLKAELGNGRKATTREYWLKEARQFRKQANERAALLRKLMHKKSFKL